MEYYTLKEYNHKKPVEKVEKILKVCQRYIEFLYRFVHGHTEMQIPHVPSVTLNTLPLSTTAFLQLNASNKLSLSTSGLHMFPLIARPGQYLTHSSHVPQIDSLIGVPADNGISVNTPLSLIAVPYSLVTRAADFPIQPRPARVASVLNGRRVRYISFYFS